MLTRKIQELGFGIVLRVQILKKLKTKMIKHITSKEHFESLMIAYKTHILSGAKHTVSLNSAILFDAKTEALPNQARDNTKQFESSIVQFMDQQKEKLTETANKFKSEQNINTITQFKKEVDRQKKQILEEANQRIIDYYDKMTQIGNQHPESRSAILVLSDKEMSFFQGTVLKTQEFVTDLVSNTVESIGNVGEETLHFFGHAVHSVTHFFGGIF